jgi:predicted N-formylglutamate amidohydrolase
LRVRLLAPGDPAPFAVRPSGRQSPLVIICDHAGRNLPQRLGTLGLSEADLSRHIASDIGAHAVANLLGEALGAVVIGQTLFSPRHRLQSALGDANIDRRGQRAHHYSG